MILIVEDDPEIRETLAQVLEDEGYAVATAENGRDALVKLSELPRPCLILLDLMMPVMSGSEFLVALRQRPVADDIPVIIVSAWPREAAAVHGARAFLGKPVDLQELLSWVSRFCTTRGA
jgi:CheY-like chemotaxis protein